MTGRPVRLTTITRPDGSQMLLTEWGHGHDLATRGNRAETWSPPESVNIEIETATGDTP